MQCEAGTASTPAISALLACISLSSADLAYLKASIECCTLASCAVLAGRLITGHPARNAMSCLIWTKVWCSAWVLHHSPRTWNFISIQLSASVASVAVLSCLIKQAEASMHIKHAAEQTLVVKVIRLRLQNPNSSTLSHRLRM